MEQSRVVTVEINGQRYPIRSHLDAAYIADLAAYVDAKMQLAMRECPSGDTLKLAVLAALNIADECFRARDDDTARRHDLTKRTAELERMLDLALESVTGAPDGPAPALARTGGSF
jgi:cell division protein ZapA